VWARIRTACDYPGWIRADALGGEPDREWPGLARAGDPVEGGARVPGRALRMGRADRARDRLLRPRAIAYRRLGRLVPREEELASALAGDPVRFARL
jgi:hypothetical protein